MLTPARCATRAVGMLFTARSPLAASMATGSSPQAARVTIDLSYGEQMSAQEHKSLARQLRTAYGLNLKAEVPLSLHLTSLGAAEAHPAQLPADGSWRHWPHVSFITESAASHFDTAELVWLSPDAQEPLLELSPAEVYVVSGYIDRTVNRGASLGRAKEIGVRARRLPLQEYAPRPNLHPILSVVSVVEILAAVHSGETWASAIERFIPQRAIKRREREHQEPKKARAPASS